MKKVAAKPKAPFFWRAKKSFGFCPLSLSLSLQTRRCDQVLEAPPRVFGGF